MTAEYDAIVVGSGPNGLTAAITLAHAGCSVLVYEASSSPGGGARSAALTLDGYVHDVCSAVHPLARASPIFSALSLNRFGLEWVQPTVPLAHPLEGGGAAPLYASLEETAAGLGADGPEYRRLIRPFAERLDDLLSDVLGPLRFPRHPLLAARFGRHGIQSAQGLIRKRFRGEAAISLFAGLCCHSQLELNRPLTAAFGVMLAALGHSVGWPMPRGGAGRLTDALVECLSEMGGKLVTDRLINSLDELPSASAVLLDVTPAQLLDIAGTRLDPKYRAALSRFRYGCGVYKLDFALSEPAPFLNEACRRAGTVHIGLDLHEMEVSESLVGKGLHAERPFVLYSQPSVFDNSRAPAGRHVGWAYCHTPLGSRADMSRRITAQIERFAPGFRDCILEQHSMHAMEMEAYNPNYVGGDINGGRQDIGQLLARPVRLFDPYRLPVKGLYVCSSSTPPGGGVHGMCGFHAARSALRREFGLKTTLLKGNSVRPPAELSSRSA